jgi:hypothetical protein
MKTTQTQTILTNVKLLDQNRYESGAVALWMSTVQNNCYIVETRNADIQYHVMFGMSSAKSVFRHYKKLAKYQS